MSTKIHLWTYKFEILAKNIKAAGDALDNFLPLIDNVPRDLFSAMQEIGFSVLLDEQGNVTNIDLVDDYSNLYMEEGLNAIVPHVSHGSFLLMSNDNGDLWQYTFKDRCLYIYDGSDCALAPLIQGQDLEHAHELLDGAGVPRKKRGKVELTLAHRIELLLEHKNPAEDRTS